MATKMDGKISVIPDRKNERMTTAARYHHMALPFHDRSSWSKNIRNSMVVKNSRLMNIQVSSMKFTYGSLGILTIMPSNYSIFENILLFFRAKSKIFAIFRI